MKNLLAMAALLVTGAMATPALHAATPDTLAQSAGPVPSDALVNAAISSYLRGKNPLMNSKKPFRILSGPTLASGNTFAGNLEQAWLMCIVINSERMAPGPQEIEGRSLYLRTSGTRVVVVPTENWKDSSPQCDR
ncbi:MAG: hypothetical protein V4542_09415 [Pseudomonadota bacterium]